MQQTCRLCLKSSTDNIFDSALVVDSKQFDLVLPEIDINIIDSPVVCTVCINLLNEACAFKKICLKTENHLRDVIQKYKSTKLEELLKADIPHVEEEVANIAIVLPQEKVKSDPVNDNLVPENNENKPDLVEQDEDTSIDGDIADEDASLQDDSLACQFCNKQYGHIKALRRHLKSHIGTKPSCSLCDRTFYDTTGLKRHKLRYHGDSDKEALDKLVCKPCNKVFYYISAFRRHNRNCHGINEPPLVKKEESPDESVEQELKYFCSICNKGFQLNRVLKRHMKTHSETFLDCDQCDKKFRLQEYLREHKQRVHGTLDQSLNCDECKVDFTSPLYLRNHIRNHHNTKSSRPKRVKSFACDICSRKYFTLASFNRHKAEHKVSKDEFKCKFCEAQLTSKFFLNNHINQFHYEKRDDLKYICKFCDAEFSTKQDMLIHRKETHPSEEIQRYTCDACGITCYGRANLKNHLLIHTGKKPYTCDVCGVSFYQLGSLNVHKKATHSDEKPFACGYCGRRFSLKGMLTKHLQSVHLKDMIEKKYKCTFCDKAFRIESTLKYHMRWHTDERTYNCDICNKAFIDRSSVHKHRRIHFEKTNICEVCGKGFHQKSNLKIHMRVHQK